MPYGIWLPQRCTNTPLTFLLRRVLLGTNQPRRQTGTSVIDAFGNAVVWIDEVEKAFAGSRSSGETDSGTTASMFAHFLTWMQETQSPVLVMATANDVRQLPPEFLRAGRFDATFFVDLPCLDERRQIIDIVNRKWGTSLSGDLAEKLNGYTGAEIEQLAKDSLFEGIEAAMSGLVPLSRTMREEISALRDWAKTRARLANTVEDTPEQRKIRRVQ